MCQHHFLKWTSILTYEAAARKKDAKKDNKRKRQIDTSGTLTVIASILRLANYQHQDEEYSDVDMDIQSEDGLEAAQTPSTSTQ